MFTTSIIKLILFFLLVLILFFKLLLVSIPGLSLSSESPRSSTTFAVRVLIGSGLLAWSGLIVTYFIPVLRPMGFLILIAWLIVVWRRCGLAGILEQLKPARDILVVQLLACLLVL